MFQITHKHTNTTTHTHTEKNQTYTQIYIKTQTHTNTYTLNHDLINSHRQKTQKELYKKNIKAKSCLKNTNKLNDKM